MKNTLRTILLLALAAVLALTFCACGATDKAKAPDSASAPAVKDTLKVGLECGYAPFNWTQLDNSNGAVPISGTSEFAGGYDVEIAKRLAKALDKELVIVKTAWDGLVPAVQSGVIDVIIAGMSPTAERKDSIDFSDNYYTSDLVMVVKKGGKYDGATAIADFAGAKITAQLNTFHYTVIDQITDVQQQSAMEDFPAMRVALESGVIDGYVSERPEGVSAAAANESFKMITFEEGKGFTTSPDDTAIAVGIKKGNTALLESINKELATITAEEQLSIMDAAIANQPAA